jgi:uroporphyrinogen-III synthase
MAAGVQPLAGRGIVLTRPRQQAAALAALIEREGGRAILFPTIEIRDIDDRAALEAVIDRLDAYDLAIFVSPNAVDKGLQAVRSRRALPPQLRIAAIGGASARALQRLGVSAVIAPAAGDDSESLLRMPELSEVAGARVVVFRGVGGRELIRGTLEARGASVEYAECYRRVVPDADLAVLEAAWVRGEIDAFVATSSESLRNLHAMLDGAARERLSRAPIFVTHPRIAAAARALRLDNIMLTGSGDERIAAAASSHFAALAR